MTIKKVGFKKKTALAVTRNVQLLLTGAFCRLIATHFSDADNIVIPVLKKNVYSDDQTKTKILIQPHYKWETAIELLRPAVIIKRETLTTQKIAIGDGFGENLDEGLPKTKFINCAHTVYCLSEQGGSSEILGEEVFQMLLEFAPAIREDFSLLSLEISSVGEVSKIKEFDEHFGVPITIT